GKGEAALPVNAPSEEAARGQASREAQKKAWADLLGKILALRHPSGRTLGELAFNADRRERLRELVEGESGEGQAEEDRVYSWRVKIALENVWRLVKDWR
ncbi:MAG: hypothetical protein ACYS47_20585, partial [Planctomycetota bacterium]